jgi:hypothetical protein
VFGLDRFDYLLFSLQMQEKAMRKASYFLHMPPVMKSEQSNVQFYSKDEEIAPFLDHKFVFTDISKGVKDRVC